MARNRKRAKEKRARRPQAVAYRAERDDAPRTLGERQARSRLEDLGRDDALPESEARRPLADLERDDAFPERDNRDPPASLTHDEELGPSEEDETPGPITHAAPDVELAEAQLALGRSEFDRESQSLAADESEPEPEDRPETAFEDETELEDDYETGVEGEYETGVEGEYEAGVYGSDAEDEALDQVSARARSDAGFDGEPAPGPRGELVAPAGGIAERRALPGNRVINFLQGSWRELQRVQWPDRRQVTQATAVVIGFVIVAGVFLGVADFFAGKLVDYILK